MKTQINYDKKSKEELIKLLFEQDQKHQNEIIQYKKTNSFFRRIY
jgi:hypothetical protein